MLKLIQEEIDLGMLGTVNAEIVFWWHPGQKEIITMDPACSQEGIKPHCEGIAKVSLFNFPLDRDCDVTSWVHDSAHAAKEIEDVIDYFMKHTPEEADDIHPDEWTDYET